MELLVVVVSVMNIKGCLTATARRGQWIDFLTKACTTIGELQPQVQYLRGKLKRTLQTKTCVTGTSDGMASPLFHRMR
jgi:hypothetical protein